MDKGQSELTSRIRSAIKKKLVEINAFVDNELPDYIMILVANKRSKSHMKKDLSLFLGKDTASFTNWLWDLVSNLKVKSSSKEKRNEENDQEEKVVPSDEDVLDYDPNEQEGDFLDQEENFGSQNVPSIPKDKPLSKSTETLPPNINTVKPINQVLGKDSCEATGQKSIKVYPVQPIPQTGSVSTTTQLKNKLNPEDEYDPTKPEFTGTISSIVRVTEKKFSRPGGLQVNKLLQRAVDDATKSVLDGKSLDDFYKPTPIKVLSSTRRNNAFTARSRNLVTVQIDSGVNATGDEDQPGIEPNIFRNNDNEIEVRDWNELSVYKQEDYFLDETPQYTRTICLASDQIPKCDTSDYPVEYSMKEEVKEKSPRFIVTLDGVELPSLKRKFIDSEESMDTDDEDLNEEEEEDYEETSPEKKLKVTKRCKYWPACKNSDSCIYHHPTIQCKCFPDCNYGDKCFYIHPNCKFDALCSRKDCPYTHASKRKFPLRVAVPKPPMNKPRSTKIVCKFYPKCTVKNCTFIHPKFCRYGTTCRSATCTFTHLNIPPRNQLKWNAKTAEEL